MERGFGGTNQSWWVKICKEEIIVSVKSKIGLLASASINRVLNAAISANSLAILDECLERMSTEVVAIRTAMGVELGRIKTLDRQVKELNLEIEKRDTDLNKLVKCGDLKLAVAEQTILNTKVALRGQLADGILNAQAEVAKLEGLAMNMESQLEAAKSKRAQVAALVEQRKAAEIRVKAVSRVGGHYAGHIDGIAERLRQEVETAQGIAEANEDTLDAKMAEAIGAGEVEAQIAARKEQCKNS